jgi:fatty-acyl-CoA synthase
MSAMPLTIPFILRHAMHNHRRSTLTTRLADGSAVRFTYPEFGARVARLAYALGELGVTMGDRVASFAWNTHQHLELYYAVPGIGAVLHTTNIRLFPEQVAFVLDHAGDDVVFVDDTLVPLMHKAIAVDARLADKTYVVMGDAPHEPLPHELRYETLLAGKADDYDWPELDENTAAVLCYTSATTGDPKGVLFSHRSQVLHAFATSFTDVFALRQSDVVLPIVPMFHVNAWGLPYSTIMLGADIVFPGPRMDAESLYTAMHEGGVTFSAGVPTVWLALRDYLQTTGKRLPALSRIVIGGSACPPALFDDLEELGIAVIHAWGMTEMSPIGTVNYDKGEHRNDAPEVRRARRLKQGPFTPFVQWQVLDDDGNAVAHDGVARGELWVRGFAVARAYYRNDEATAAAFKDGWFTTGDIVTVDEDGYMEIVDRSKDLVKSGGEWISSVELENTLMGHPHVREACVFGVKHAKWLERPVAAVVLRDGAAGDETAMRAWLGERVAKWWLPDRILFVDAIPRTGVGKFLKRDLRERYAEILADSEAG